MGSRWKLVPAAVVAALAVSCSSGGGAGSDSTALPAFFRSVLDAPGVLTYSQFANQPATVDPLALEVAQQQILFRDQLGDALPLDEAFPAAPNTGDEQDWQWQAIRVREFQDTVRPGRVIISVLFWGTLPSETITARYRVLNLYAPIASTEPGLLYVRSDLWEQQSPYTPNNPEEGFGLGYVNWSKSGFYELELAR
jgi:hypothetical protein